MEKEKKDAIEISKIVNILENISENKENMKTEQSTKKDIAYNKELHSKLKEIGKSKDVSLIINAERVIIEDKIDRSKSEGTFNKGSDKSLNESIKDLSMALNSLDKVYDKEWYKSFDANITDKKIDRIKGVPRDPVHRFIDSNITRVNNSIISSTANKNERNILVERVSNMKIAKNEYMQLQAKTLDIDLPEKSKRLEKERD